MEEYVWISKAIRMPIFARRAHPVVMRMGQEWNVKVTIAGPENLQDGPYIQAINEAIDRNVAGIMLHGWGVPAEKVAINRAVARGIPVVTVDSDIPGSQRLAHVGTDWFRMGSAIADQIVSLAGESAKILLMGDAHLANNQAGFRGFLYRMDNYTDVAILGPVDDSAFGDEVATVGPHNAEVIALKYLEQYPDLDGIVGFDYNGGVGIANALEKTRLGGKVKVVCVDAEDPQVEFIKEGIIQAAFAQRRELFTYQAFQMLYTYNHGSAVTGYQPGPANIAGNIDTGFIIVTKGNVDSFEDSFSLEDAFEHRALTRRLELMSAAVDSSGQMTLAVDGEGHIMYANPVCIRLTEWSEEQLVGCPIDRVFDLTEVHRTLIQSGVATGTPVTFETTARRGAAFSIPVQLTVSPMKTGAAGSGQVFIAADITARKLAETALRESEMRWQFALAGDGVWDWYPETGEVFYSPQWKAILGYMEHEIANTYEEWDRRLHPDDRAGVLAHLGDVLTGKVPNYVCEQRLLCKDGTYKWILDRGKVVRWSDDGKPLRVIGTHSDITPRKQAEEVLHKEKEYAREFQERLKTLHEVNLELIAAPTLDAMCIKAIELGRSGLGFDRIGLLLFEDAEHASRYGIESNRELRVERGLDYTTREDSIVMSGILTHRDSVFVGEDVELRDFDRVVGRGWNMITGIWDGTTCTGWIAVDNFLERKPLIPYQVEVLRLYGLTIGNLVARRFAEAEIRRLNAELEQRVKRRTQQLEAANSELEAFAYSVSHDLRTPLRAIDGFSQALLEDNAHQLDEQGRHYLERVRAGSQRMGRLIDDLLKLSRVTRQEMRDDTVDLSAIAREVADELRELDPGRDAEFKIADHLLAHGDERLLRLVFENLLSNAWKFTRHSPRAVIEFDAAPSAPGEERTFWIRDNGVGFDMAYVGKLFGVFQRLHGQNEFEGTGVGLATVKRIIQRHGGRVWAESGVNQGATIYFTLGHET